MTRNAGPIALALLLLAPCGFSAGGARADEAGPVPVPAAAAPAGWDDGHMRTRYPRYSGSGSSIPRLILPAGSENTKISKGRRIYATPDRSWESGDSTSIPPRSSKGISKTLGAPVTSRSASSRSSSLRRTATSNRSAR
jgi:hypothetical protein